MENNYYVYEWIRLDTNEPFYVGKGKGKRWRKLRRDGNDYFNNIVNKHPVVVNILHDNLDEETAYGLECYYIWLYRDIIGYNMCNLNDGGEGNSMLCMYGELNPFYGKHHTEETKEKMKMCKLGKPLSEETKRKVSENNAWKGKKRPEHSEKMKGKMCGELNPMYGRCGENNPTAKAVICITTNTVFYSMSEATKYYNIKHPGSIGAVCRGKSNYCGKLPDGTPLVWKYIEIIRL